MKAVIYYTEIAQGYQGRNMEHMIGEKLLEAGLFKEKGRKLAFEPRGKGEHGKPFFTLLPQLHYNISHSGRYVLCIFTRQEVGLDIQEHRKVNYERMLKRMVPEERLRQILASPHMEEEFFKEWVLREAYVKWTGEGLSMDFTRIPMNRGWHAVLKFCEDYSVAVWSEEEMEIRWEQVEITLP
ncbi:MAG TPA: 4'-phosphopantetheinyl transferase superfamily protein [Candidatus Blautia faecavium]|uniref:4'-phosphopantetheinyl transferase superfamily protein n=1 Tax=Candidatus Blautia faecavium TaxID=2838487 RepID=A0A9D2LWJ6_9FIRM|nr:4'-phosphopantetheinyl transferase superfamily protein [Candidatus Blautia faecavium]